MLIQVRYGGTNMCVLFDLYEKKNLKLWFSHVGKYEVFTFGSFQH